jgi:hypothetical protein
MTMTSTARNISGMRRAKISVSAVSESGKRLDMTPAQFLTEFENEQGKAPVKKPKKSEIKGVRGTPAPR